MATMLKTTLEIAVAEIRLAVGRGAGAAEIAEILDAMERHDRRERFRLLGRTVARANERMMELVGEGDGEPRRHDGTKGSQRETMA